MSPNNYRENCLRRKILVPGVLGVYLIYLFILTLAPFDFSLFYFKQFFSSSFPNCIAFIFHARFPDVLNNILLFLPFGMLLFLLHGKRTKRTETRLWIPIFVGAFLSMFIEGAQLFLERSTSIIDIITNTTGTALGFYVMGRWDWLKKLFLVIRRAWQKFSFRFMTTLLYTAFFIALMLLPLKINNLNNWNENFHLLIGNEETLDRPWEGEVSLVAIYKKSLSLSEIRTFYKSGMNGNIKERSANGAVALYSFSEDAGDTLNDFSGVGEPLVLVGRDVKWLGGGRGIKISDGNFLRSPLPAKKIVRAVRRTSQMAIEVWLRTENLTQTGPARIVSLSSSPDERNFTVGQNREDIHFRVRTPLTGPNGSLICLKARSVLKDRETHHIAATFNRGVERLVIDGRPCGVVRGDIDYLPYLLRMGSALTGKLAFVFVFVFPLGLFFYSLFPRYRFVLALISVGAIVSLIEIFYFFYAGQPFGFFFFLTSLVISGLSGIMGSIIERSICQQ